MNNTRSWFPEANTVFDQTSRSIDVQVFDGAFGSGIANTAITFGTIINQPTTIRDVYVGSEDTSLTVPVGNGLLVNDTDPNAETLTLLSAVDGAANAITINAVGAPSPTVHMLPSGASLTLYADGSFDYVPAPDFSGVEFFNYTVENTSGFTSTSYAAINIQGVADAPSIPTGIASAVSDEDQPTNSVDVTSTQGDVDGSETLRYSVTAIPAGYTITDGNLQYTSSSLTSVAFLDGWDLTSISLLPPATPDHSDVDIVVQLTVESSEPNGSTTSATENVKSSSTAAVSGCLEPCAARNDR